MGHYHKSNHSDDACKLRWQQAEDQLKNISQVLEKISRTQEIDFGMTQERRLADQGDHKEFRGKIDRAEELLTRLYEKVKSIENREDQLLQYHKQEKEFQLELQKTNSSMRKAIITAIVSALGSVVIALIGLFS
jgi:DNA repair ATPase RecN